MVEGRADGHIDVRVSQATKERFYELYHKWVPGKEDDSMEAFLLFLTEQGQKALTATGLRTFKNF